MAAQLLNDLIEGRPIESEYVVLPVDLIERASVRMLEK
jgi:DNA-binding LacI/PurR family transcriptional regulator